MADSKLQEDRVDHAWRIVKELTWPRVIIGVATLLALLILMYVYRNLDTAIPQLLTNNLAMFSLILATLLAVIGGIGGRLYLRLQTVLERVQFEMTMTMRGQLEHLDEQQRACLQREMQSVKRMALMNNRMNLMERALVQAEVRISAFGHFEE